VTSFALTPYPLSRDFGARLDELAGEEVEVVRLAELRRLGATDLVRRLRGLRGRCFLPVEDENAAALLPVLELLATLSRASTIEVLDPSLAPNRVSRAQAALSSASIVTASLDAQLALARTRRTITRLLEAGRSPGAAGPERHVLYLNGNLWFGLKAGGSIAHMGGVVNALAKAGYSVELASASVPAELDGQVTVLPLRPPRSFGWPPEANAFRWNESLQPQLAGARTPSFVYQRHSLGSVAGVLLARRLRRPLVLEYNGSEAWIGRHWGRPLHYEQLALRAEAASLRHAAVVVAISAALRDELIGRGVEPERIAMHPNGVDAGRFDPERFGPADRERLRAGYGIARDAVVATFVGTFGRWHGAELLAQAIGLLAAEQRQALLDTKLRFMFVGDGVTMPEVRRLLSGHDDIATLAGLVPQDEAPHYLAASDICVVPTIPNADGSPFFGSPTKLFEYMAAGTAVVASDLDQVGEVLRGGGDPLGVLVEPGSAAALAAAVLDLAADEDRRRRLGSAARRAVLEQYTWDDHIEAILAVVDRARG
jgi:glycosyltransferase involved in cell wall biosynthesis